LDLHLDLTGQQPRAALEHALREAVQSGRLVAAVRLPSSRSLAADLGIARNTVADVYEQLTAEGWLASRQGSGTWVADRIAPDDVGASRMTSKIHTSGRSRPRLDLRPGSPDVASFPRARWLAAARQAVQAAPDEAFGYIDPRGLPQLRHTLAQYLARARGVRTSPDRIVVCSGFVQAMSLLGTALQRSGATAVAAESPGVGLHRDALAATGLAVTPLCVDGGGIVTSDLSLSEGSAALLTPAHQFPLGVVLRPDRREAAIDWARETSGVLIEDDYDGEFRYDRQPVGALQALDPARVIFVGTASKTLAPGLRLAWMAVPSTLLDAVIAAKRVSDLHTGVMEQLTLSRFIESGEYDRHIRRSRLKYRKRRDRLVDSISASAPQIRVTGISAGLHAVLDLSGMSTSMSFEDEVVSRAAAQGVAVSALGTFRFAGEPGAHPALVVGYGTPSDSSFSPALEALCQTLSMA
jgi:GntR family transcriptional regulator/MocR family aminotransferase